MIFILINWLTWAKKNYHGPQISLQVPSELRVGYLE